MNGRYHNTYSGRESPRDYRRPIDPEEEEDYSYDGDHQKQQQQHPDDEPGPIGGGGGDYENDVVTGAEDAVLDLAELEQLHEESERMKGLGNKHMAAQVSYIIRVYFWGLKSTERWIGC